MQLKPHDHERLIKVLQDEMNHPSTDELLDYLTLNQNVLSSHDKPSDASTMSSVHEHLQSCEICLERIAYYKQEIDSNKNIFWETAEELDFEREFIPQKRGGFWAFNLSKVVFRPALAILTIIMVVSGIYLTASMFSYYSVSENYKYATIVNDNYDALPSFRTGSSSFEANSETFINLGYAGLYLRQGKYSEAERILKTIDRQKLKSGDLLKHQLYELMLTLKQAHKTTFKLFPKFDKKAVSGVIERSEQTIVALKMENSPDAILFGTRYYGLLCYYLGKAYLMIDDEGQAYKYFKESDSVRGHGRNQEVKTLLKELEPKSPRLKFE